MDHTVHTEWEYCRRMLFVWGKIEEMNRMGREGWEVCGLWFFFVYFKRPLRQTVLM
jgi:hypothetical protein